MGDIAIVVDNIGKRYRLGETVSYKMLRESITNVLVSPFRRILSPNHKRAPERNSNYIWALKNISFKVESGEILGIIGGNGAGKSTLLKILSRITEPSEGRAEIYGRVSSLLEVGTGFHPELSGRENIYFNGAVLGMKKAVVDRKFDEIARFSGVEKFLDTPVKHYSSGMYVRLAFAVAAHLDPDVLIVDEVLAVGDEAFQNKCLGTMNDVAGGGRTVLFVSHNMNAVRSLCKRTILLNQGQIEMDGKTANVLDHYLEKVKATINSG